MVPGLSGDATPCRMTTTPCRTTGGTLHGVVSPEFLDYDVGIALYRGTLLIRKRPPLGPYNSPMPRALWGSWGGGRFLMREVPL